MNLDFVIPINHKSFRNIPILCQRLHTLVQGQTVKIFFIYDRHDKRKDEIAFLASKYAFSYSIDSYNLISYDVFLNEINNCHLISSDRYGWYWQQLVKLLAFRIPGISNQIVLWDSDTYPINTLAFFDNQVPIITPSYKEYHIPYFLSYANLNRGKLLLPPFSSISQYMPVLKSELVELYLRFVNIDELNQYGDSDVSNNIEYNDSRLFLQAFFTMLSNVQNNSLFSEYETITLNRISHLHPFLVSNYRFFRNAGFIPLPTRMTLRALSLLTRYDIATFESSHNLCERICDMFKLIKRK